jgi:hypothetical protein
MRNTAPIVHLAFLGLSSLSTPALVRLGVSVYTNDANVLMWFSDLNHEVVTYDSVETAAVVRNEASFAVRPIIARRVIFGERLDAIS